MAQQDFVDLIIGDMRLDDENLSAWDGEGGAKELIPPGEYLFEVVFIKQAMSKAQNPMLETTYRVVSDGPAHGKTTIQRYMLIDNEGSRGRLKHVLQKLGVPILPGGSFSLGEWMNRQMYATLEHEQSTGFNTRTNKEVTYTNERMSKEREVDVAPAAASKSGVRGNGAAPGRTPVGNTRPAAR